MSTDGIGSLDMLEARVRQLERVVTGGRLHTATADGCEITARLVTAGTDGLVHWLIEIRLNDRPYRLPAYQGATTACGRDGITGVERRWPWKRCRTCQSRLYAAVETALEAVAR